MSEFSIKEWAEDDRPREKLLHKGKASLSTAELIAIIMGSGSKEHSAVGLSKKLLSSVSGLDELARKPIDFYTSFKGIGPAKAISITAALELGRRRQLTRADAKIKITSSTLAYDLLGPVLSDLPHEEFWIVSLNRANQVIAKDKISTGGVSGTIVDPKLVFSHALRRIASSIILFHNHPSGQLTPSQADLSLTGKLIAAGRLLDIKVQDHLIIGNNQYFSFLDEGKM